MVKWIEVSKHRAFLNAAQVLQVMPQSIYRQMQTFIGHYRKSIQKNYFDIVLSKEVKASLCFRHLIIRSDTK